MCVKQSLIEPKCNAFLLNDEFSGGRISVEGPREGISVEVSSAALRQIVHLQLSRSRWAFCFI